MARVPLANDPIDPRPIDPGFQRVDAPAAAFGSLQARGAMVAGNELADIGNAAAQRALVQQQFDNERELKKADVTLADKIRVITYGDGTEQNRGYYSLQGDDAIAQAGAVIEAIARAHQEVLADLPNERTRRVFAEAGRARVVSEQTAVGRHLETQRRKANDLASAARMDAAISDAATRWNEPAQLAKSRAIIANEVADFAARNGLGEDAAKAMLREQNAKLLSHVIQAAGRVDAQAAKKIFDENQDWLPGTALAAIEREMRTNLEFERRAREHAILLREKEERRAALEIENEFVKRLAADPATVSVEEVANSGMTPDQKLRWVAPGGILDRALKQPDSDASRYGPAFLDVFRRIHADEDDPNRISDPSVLDGMLGNGLTVAGLAQARQELFGKRTVEGQVEADLKKGLEAAARAALTGTNPLLGLRDPKGDEQLQRFMAFFLTEYQRQRSAGKTAVQLLDPDSPDYLGKAIERFKRRPDEFMRDLIESNPGNEALDGAASIPSRAKRTAVNPKTGEKLYDLGDGVWLRADGTRASDSGVRRAEGMVGSSFAAEPISDEDIIQAQQAGMLYGTGHEEFAKEKVGKDFSGENYTAAYKLANKSALMALGYDPRVHAIDDAQMDSDSSDEMTVFGTYSPVGDEVTTRGGRYKMFNPVVLAHEFGHRGLQLLARAYPEDDDVRFVLQQPDWEEAIVRSLHHRVSGTKPSEWELERFPLLKSNKLDAFVRDIEKLAQRLIKERRPGGPR